MSTENLPATIVKYITLDPYVRIETNEYNTLMDGIAYIGGSASSFYSIFIVIPVLIFINGGLGGNGYYVKFIVDKLLKSAKKRGEVVTEQQMQKRYLESVS